MPKNHERFHSTNGKRQILVVDDEAINRELLGLILQEEYEVVYAADGAEALERIRAYRETLSLVLLDLLMPVLSGIDVLKEIKADPDLARIPVIVLTSERDAEIESLNLGAIDFIPKPYPAPGVVQARVLRTIELSEDRDIIQSTERDPLTGLYNREFFYRYAEQYDQFHKEKEMDAIIVDINHFHMINERYGKPYGDDVLRRIGEKVREMVTDSGGIVCRREADTFMVYCPHREDYKLLLDSASVGVAGDNESSKNRVRLRMGVYSNVDKSLDIERRFDRAKMAADSVKGNFTNNIGIYDVTLHERELYAEQLIEDFPKAIAEKQFQVYYQPKFDIRPDTPILTSAEALIRWVHPELGMISPGVFIPLFEENGLIQKMDTFVWNETARQIQDWKQRLNHSVPVSVNVSRIDMYDPELVNTFQELLQTYGLDSSDLMLEVTESAYTQDSEQIIDTVNELRSMGFLVEMDDFGTGYSSLNMISTIPIDALKLDMQFIRNAFQPGGSTRMLEVIIEISDYLGVPVIAEGVETEVQMDALRMLGCDIVQGYFFSKPVPAWEFEPFILQNKEAKKNGTHMTEEETENVVKSAQLDAIRESIAAEKEPEDVEEKAPSKEDAKPGLQLRTMAIFFVVLSFIAAVSLLLSDISVNRGYVEMEQASNRYIEAQQAAANMETGSDYLTDRVRCFVVTGEQNYLNDYLEEVNVIRTRDKAIEDLQKLINDNDAKGQEALDNLNTAMSLSNELIETEYLAMHLMIEAGHYDLSTIPDEIKNIKLSEEDLALTGEEMRKKAQTLVFDNNYMHYKDHIRENVNLCTQSLIRSSSQELKQASTRMEIMMNIQTLMTILFLMIVLAMVYMISQQVRKPLTEMIAKMQAQEVIIPKGVEELRFVSRTYNDILRENMVTRERLSHEASHDALTGLFNRGAYDMLMESVDTEHMALLIIDVDYFKQVNDTYGHTVGDRVLKRVAEILKNSFRSVDILCRIGGDEFVVVMTRVNGSMRQLVQNKIDKANELLQHPKDDLPPVSLSVGVAFSDRENPQGDIFKDADTALYKAKEAGRCCCAFYE